MLNVVKLMQLTLGKSRVNIGKFANTLYLHNTKYFVNKYLDWYCHTRVVVTVHTQ